MLAGSYITDGRTVTSIIEVVRTVTYTTTIQQTATEVRTETVTVIGDVKDLIVLNPIVYHTCVSNSTEPSPNCDSPGDQPLTAIDIQIIPLREVTILIDNVKVFVDGEELIPVFIAITDKEGNPLKSATLNEAGMLSIFIERVPVGSGVVVKLPYKAGEAVKEEVVRPTWIG